MKYGNQTVDYYYLYLQNLARALIGIALTHPFTFNLPPSLCVN